MEGLDKIMKVNTVEKKTTINSNKPSFGVNPKKLLNKAKNLIGIKAKQIPFDKDAFLAKHSVPLTEANAKKAEDTIKEFEEHFGGNIFEK